MKTQNENWSEDSVPYICWDRSWTVGEIRKRLQAEDSTERGRVLAWLMRELKPGEVWLFVTPAQVYQDFASVAPLLGKTRQFWQYLLGTWHELGKI